MKLVLILSFLLLLVDVSNAQVISAGGRHSLAICSDSTVQTWGYNAYGQLGNATMIEQHSGVRAQGLTGIVNVAGGLFHSLFVKNDGTVWSCGRNSLGPLGDGTNMDRTIPVKVSGLTNIVHAAAGGEHSLFLKKDGTAWACGNNTSGQLGDGTKTNRLTPVQVIGITGIVQIAAGAEYTLFLKNDGTVWACGHNGYGQHGNASTSSSNTPVQIPGLSDIVQISTGEWHSLFVKKDGTVYSAGRNQYGQLGVGTIIDRNTVTQISNLSGVVQAEAGGIHSVFLKEDGSVWSCGLNSGGNNDGQLGDGSIIDRHNPVQVIPSWGMGKIIRVEATREHSLYLHQDGKIWASGRNNYGQLGNGKFTGVNSSTSILSLGICKSLVTSNKKPNEEVHFSTFPNPVLSGQSLEIKGNINLIELSIYNSMGHLIKLISKENFNFSNNAVIETNNLLSGMYILLLRLENNQHLTKKIIIQAE